MTLASKFSEMGVNYREDGGMYCGIFNEDGGRTQFFMCDPNADLFAGAEDYDFYSPIGDASDAGKVKAACEKAGILKRGAIVVINGKICLKFEVPTDLDALATRSHLEAVCRIADDYERHLFGTDHE